MSIYESNGGDREITNITKINLCLDFLFLRKVLDKTDSITDQQFKPKELEGFFSIDLLKYSDNEDFFQSIYR